MGREPDTPKKRPYGQGNIVETGPGLFRLRVYMGRDIVTGRPIQKSRQFQGTRAGAEKALQQFRAELAMAPVPKQTSSTKVLLRDVIEEHLEASTLAPGTRRSYESALRKHIADGIGRERAEALTATKFRAYYRALASDRGLSASSIWSIYSLISGSLRRAAREQGLRFDFNQMVTPSKPVAGHRSTRPTPSWLGRSLRQMSSVVSGRCCCGWRARRGCDVGRSWR